VLPEGLRLGHIFTLRHPELVPPGAPEDWDDEADTADTHAAIAATWRALGHRVDVSLDTAVAPLAAFERLRGVDLAVNLAVGTGGRSREAQSAAILEALRVPYLGSPPLALRAGP
jgi:D-alanine-D-alanine ligase-like ATP-grasp enzyme